MALAGLEAGRGRTVLVESDHMDLASLLAGVDVIELVGRASPCISSLTSRARDASPGSLFFCLQGARADGHDFAAEAAAAGAVAIVCERRLPLDVPQIVVASARRAMALMAARFYGDPSSSLKVVGVTGTNGKTTTAHLLARCIEEAGLPCALLGTVVNRIGGKEHPVTLTTAESTDLQRMFRDMVDAGDKACAMEASSHALSLQRTVGTHFAAAVFTNLTRDHLDYHTDLEDYFRAKRRLFLPDDGRQEGAVAVINADDEWGRRLAEECRERYGADLWTYGTGATADATVADVTLQAEGSTFALRVPRLDEILPIRTRLGGRFNVENAAAAATTVLAMGLPARAALQGIASTAGVNGRFEAIRCGQPFTVLVDYAHTPDSLENALRAARDICAGRLHVVFGCGGDRDRGKRPLMGAAAVHLADRVIVTSDNPRSEDPEAIIGDILEGIDAGAGHDVSVEPDRRAAIGLALKAAHPGDVVVIAGKGHETGQIIAGRKLPFDDHEVARDWLINHASTAP